MKEYKFKISIQKELPMDIPLETTRKFPVIKNYLVEVKEKHIHYKFTPSKNFKEDGYLKFLMKYLKKLYSNNLTTCKVEILEKI